MEKTVERVPLNKYSDWALMWQCPTCPAGPGRKCHKHRKGGGKVLDRPHPERVHKAQEWLDNYQRRREESNLRYSTWRETKAKELKLRLQHLKEQQKQEPLREWEEQLLDVARRPRRRRAS